MAWSGIVGDRLIAAVELRDPKLHIARHLGPRVPRRLPLFLALPVSGRPRLHDHYYK
jgi:hypothetical protein